TSDLHPDGRYRDVARHARASVLLAARANNKAAIDSVFLDIPNTAGLAAEAADAAASGFAATACIHPSQVGVIRSAYQPTAEAVARAQAIIAAAADNPRGGHLHWMVVGEAVIRPADETQRRAEE